MEPPPRFELGTYSLPARQASGADSRIRTDDLHFTKVLLYQLSYIGARRLAGGRKSCSTAELRWHFAASLLSVNLTTTSLHRGKRGGAGNGNRTRTSTLGRSHSTTKLYLHFAVTLLSVIATHPIFYPDKPDFAIKITERQVSKKILAEVYFSIFFIRTLMSRELT